MTLNAILCLLKRYLWVDYYHTKKWKKMEKWKWKMKKKNRLPVELCYNYHFHRSDSSIFDIFRLNEYFWIFFYSGDDPRLKNHSCENGNYSKILQEVDFFVLHFSNFFCLIIFHSRISFQRAQNRNSIRILLKVTAFFASTED